MTMSRFSDGFIQRVFLILLSVLLLPGRLTAQTVDRDFEFATALVEWGFPDFANKVMDAVVRLNPDQSGRANIIKAEGFIAARKFPEAEALVKQMPANDPKADAIQLALAKGYFRYGQLDKARELFGTFFQKYQQPPADADLLKFFRDSAYTYSQMLKSAGDLKGASDALGKVLTTNPEGEIARTIKADQAALLIEMARTAPESERNGYLDNALKLCKEIQWGGMDVAFGQSIVTMATIEMTRGNRERARILINKEYKDILDSIDTQMKEAQMAGQSPKAGSRFLMGEILEQDAAGMAADAGRKDEYIKTLAASLTEFYNVFVQYGESDWGPKAGVRANALKSKLEGLGKTINIDLGAQAEKAAATQFRLADNLYRQRKFSEAVTEYLKALNSYPETTTSVKSLGSLMSAYVELNDPLMMKMVAEYTAERFAGKSDAATALLATASQFVNKKDDAQALALYELYLRGFPQHEKAGTILFYLGSQRKKAGDQDGANFFFQRIADNYPQDQYYPKALTQMAWGYHQAGDYGKALAGFQKLVGDIQAGPDRAQAQFTLADCLVKLGRWSEAAVELNKLVKWLEPEKDNPYATTPEAQQKRVDILSKAKFQLANCFGRITEPTERVPAMRQAAMALYTDVFTLFPQSELAPKALMGKGQIQLGLGQFDEAAKTFDELAAKFPASDEGKNALYSLARSAMEIGQFDQARGAFEKMMAASANYKPDEFTRIGQLMIDAKLFDEALRAFSQVTEDPKIKGAPDVPENRALLERALYGRGAALFARKSFPEAVTALQQFTNQFPRSGLFYDVHFLLGEAHGEMGNVGQASVAIGEIFRFTQDQKQVNQASLKLAEIQLKGGDKTGALASYQRVALLTDANKAEQRPFIEEAILKGLPIAMELGRYQDVVESCDQFLKLFPTSERVGDVRRTRAEANVKASESGAAPATPVAPKQGG
jgi:tetratricopeptide (TPR) repeat protein